MMAPPPERRVGWRPLRIAIHTSGRFHVLDLARELSALGHDVRFHSLLPPWKLRERGLDARRGVWLGWGAGPAFVGAHLLRHAPFHERANDLVRGAVDLTSSLRLQSCDVFIGMSGMSLHSLKRAKSFGALTVLERSSRHILDQMRLLGLQTERPVVARELSEYAAVDAISVPSRHVEASFVAHGFPPERLLYNPLGVDLTEFPWCRGPASHRPLSVLFAGTRSFQKGTDLLVAAAARLPHVQFDLVGSDGDVHCRPTPNLRIHYAVPQAELSRFHAGADVLVLPSRQDGFGMVMSQALASGCHVIASDHTGGPDLLALTDVGAPNPPIDIIPAGQVDALIAAITKLSAGRLRAERTMPAPWREGLSWRAYATRYEAHLLDLLHTHHQPRSSR